MMVDCLAEEDELILFFLMAECFGGDLFFVLLDFLAEVKLLVMAGCCAEAEEVISIVDCLAEATVDLAFVRADCLA